MISTRICESIRSNRIGALWLSTMLTCAGALAGGCVTDGGNTAVDDTERNDGGAGEDTSSGERFDRQGVCGIEGEARVTQSAVVGYETHYLIGDEGLGEPLCRVRFAMRYVGKPEVVCERCLWSMVVEKHSPEILVNEDDICRESALSLDDSGIEALEGQQTAYGYVTEYIGHSNVLMQLDASNRTWQAIGFAAYDEETGSLFYDRRDGYCGY